MIGHDIVVIGASAGGIPALQQILAGLPTDLPASLFVVLHSSPNAPGYLPEVLGAGSAMPVGFARDNERYARGSVYLAPPGHHLLVAEETMHVRRGPRENGFRPAVDPLFRTAADVHGPRVVGIVLSGGLDDGTHGLRLIKRHGGIAVVQHIEEATVPSMPLSAIRNVEIDHIVRAAEMGPLITRLALGQVAMGKRAKKRPKEDSAERGTRTLEQRMSIPPSPFTCTECGGALWQTRDGKLDLFRCHVGHKFTAEALANGLEHRVETALWTAFRTLEERAAFQRQLAQRARDRNLDELSKIHLTRASMSERDAATIQAVLTRAEPSMVVPVAKRAKKGAKKRGTPRRHSLK